MMKIMKSLLFALSILVSSAVVDAAQVIRGQTRDAPLAADQNDERDLGALVHEVFAPITEELKLTNEQKMQIAAIVTGAVIRAEPLMDKLDELDDQLNEAVLHYPFDEATIRQLSAQEANVMGQIVTIKARSRASMYQILTPQQRALVVDQFRARPAIEGNLGAISN